MAAHSWFLADKKRKTLQGFQVFELLQRMVDLERHLLRKQESALTKDVNTDGRTELVWVQSLSLSSVLP